LDEDEGSSNEQNGLLKTFLSSDFDSNHFNSKKLLG